MQKNNKNILLSRKYRPKNLIELKEQEVLVTTLSNAIVSSKLPQSYLFTGIRGIGKTTTARIIAKTINCTNLIVEGNIPISCEKCINCTSCSDGSHPDIVEIDAASRTGVDDIRFIIENAEYKPMMAKYKVFIVDEVHMLSKNAFNALLKLLEEPPLHCIFIFATTEIHKIPLTVISRCQRFDLKRFSREGITNLLADISKLENLNYDMDALQAIAIKGDGSARDSLSLLDQAILLASSDGGKITKSLIEEMVSSVNYSILIDFLKNIIIQNTKQSLKILEEFYSCNTDFNSFILELLNLTAYIAKKTIIEDYNSPEYQDFENDIKEIKERTDVQLAQILWQLAYNAQQELKSSLNQLQNMEMLALKMIYIFSQVTQYEIPRQRIEETKKKETIDINFTFKEFLRFLSVKREFQIIYNLLNNTELVQEKNNILILGAIKQDLKFEEFVRQNLSEYSNKAVSVKFIYKEKILNYKEKIKQEILSEEIMQNISKNFSDLEIIDILIESSK